jgi:hypothetical protein
MTADAQVRRTESFVAESARLGQRDASCVFGNDVRFDAMEGKRHERTVQHFPDGFAGISFSFQTPLARPTDITGLEWPADDAADKSGEGFGIFNLQTKNDGIADAVAQLFDLSFDALSERIKRIVPFPFPHCKSFLVPEFKIQICLRIIERKKIRLKAFCRPHAGMISFDCGEGKSP